MSNATSNEPKHHHYIPQFLLKNFTDTKEKSGKLYEYKKEHKGNNFRERTPKPIAYKKHLYTPEIEAQLSKIEHYYSDIIKGLIHHVQQ